MILSVSCATLFWALEKLKTTIAENEAAQRRTVIFCEDRLSLAAERAVCDAVGGTFNTSVYTFARFLSAECGKSGNILSAQGSAMAVRRIVEENKADLKLFNKLSAPTAAQSVYDAIALLISSRVDPQDIRSVAADGLLGGKLHDLALIYGKYLKYLEESGWQDRNGYLKKLAPAIQKSEKIKGAQVIFLGYQAFTRATEDCLRAAMRAAGGVTGIFISGKEDIYVNEAILSFCGVAEEFGGAKSGKVTGEMLPEAEHMLKGMFDPESYHRPAYPTGAVHLFEARDDGEEMEFIAAAVKKQVDAGERYSKISVMLPDIDRSVKLLNRVFSQYGIPYFADRRIPLSEHPLCSFIISLLLCVSGGCRPQDTDAVIASPYFPAEAKAKDGFRNYALRFMNYRGGVKRPVRPEAAQDLRVDAQSAESVRQTFITGLALIDKKGGVSGIFGGLFSLFELYGIEKTLADIAGKFRNGYPMQAEFNAQAYGKVTAVLKEAESLCQGLQIKDVIKILKSGFAALKISLIPPKADAVFVGDISATANIGSNVVFAAGLSGDVPAAASDFSLITDREISALEKINVKISPKIRQVGLRTRETVALNLAAFKRELYLSYSLRAAGEESAAGEIISYARRIFSTAEGNRLDPLNIIRLEKSYKALPYYASEKLPAIKQLIKYKNRPDRFWAIYAALESGGYKGEADAALAPPPPKEIKSAKALYISPKGITPTVLENFFACPYRNFMRLGLRVWQRDEGAVRYLDTGNFIHTVLEKLAKEISKITSAGEAERRAREISAQMLGITPYSGLAETAAGKYTAKTLCEEAAKVGAGMWEQVYNSLFTVASAEAWCDLKLQGGIKIYGKIDRVDQYGDMVRIIDYKTGSIDSSVPGYFVGEKMQLPLYLLSAAAGKRAVGAYYFPASLTFREKEDGVFRLRGFMDGSDDVISATDKDVKPGEKTRYTDAGLNGKKQDAVMSAEDFAVFLQYAAELTESGVREMVSGYISPTPLEGECTRCSFNGACGFADGKDRGRKKPSVNCAKIVKIVKGEEDGGE